MRKIFSANMLGVAAVVMFCSNSYAASSDPSDLSVTLFKTELYNADSAQWVTVLDNTVGSTVNLVDAAEAFGSGSVGVGRYDKIRFTVKNEFAYSYNAFDSCVAGSATSMIDGVAAATSQQELVFATDGSTSWRANGTLASPYYMSSAVDVRESSTTKVDLSFNVGNIVSCNSGTVSIAPPTFEVAMQIIPPSPTFSGGDYWIMSFSQHGAVLNLETGDDVTLNVNEQTFPQGYTALADRPVMLSSGTQALADGSNVDMNAGTIEAVDGSGDVVTLYDYLLFQYSGRLPYQKQALLRPAREERWGMRVRLDAPDGNGVGDIRVISQPGAHRHALDDTGGTKGSDWGIISSITDAGFLGIYPAIGSYIIGADNRIRLIIVTGSEAQVISGALSSDHEVIVVNPTTEERSAEMTIGIRASASTTAFQATDGRVLSWNGYSIDHTRSYSTTDASFIPSNDTVDDINLRNNASIGINRISNDGTNVAFTSINYDNALQVSGIPGGPFTVNNAAANFSAFGDDSNSMTMTVTAFNNIFGGLNDGAGTINMGSEKSFIASTASGSVTLMLPVDDYIGDTTPGDAAGGTVNHHMGMTLMTELATVGTHTRESLTGRYVLSSIWDEFSPDASTGLGVMRFGNQTGEIYLKNDGTIAVDITDKDSVGRVEIIKVNGTYFESSLGSNVTPRWTISSVCIGHSDSPTNKVRLAPNDSACTGGIIVDMVVGYLDPIETPTDLPVSDIWAAGVSRFAAFFVDTSGKTLSFTDAKVLDAPSDRRLLGYAVRIQ